MIANNRFNLANGEICPNFRAFARVSAKFNLKLHRFPFELSLYSKQFCAKTIH